MLLFQGSSSLFEQTGYQMSGEAYFLLAIELLCHFFIRVYSVAGSDLT